MTGRKMVLPATVASTAAVVAVAGVTALVVRPTHPPTAHVSARPSPPPPPVALQVVGLAKGRVPWGKPLAVAITNGHIRQVDAAEVATGRAIGGALAPKGAQWSSVHTLTPAISYRLTVRYVDLARHSATQTMTVTATDASKHLDAEISPGDGDVVGVGMPVAVTFNRWVPTRVRANVERRLSVTTSPSVTGSWHWMDGQEVHWRPPTYWKAGTHVHVAANLDRLYLGDGVWGAGTHRVSYTIGAARISTADITSHYMTVTQNGAVLRTMPISAGRDKYPTMGGVHLALERSHEVTMDSETVGIPRNSPDGYYEKVFWNVRISYGGAFVHAAPWSVTDQGHVNVSHGCINLSPADAEWFFNFTRRGDVINIVNATRRPSQTDPGTWDWNMSWADWVAGSALH